MWNLISYFFQSYESYEIKFLTKIFSFSVYERYEIKFPTVNSSLTEDEVNFSVD